MLRTLVLTVCTTILASSIEEGSAAGVNSTDGRKDAPGDIDDVAWEASQLDRVHLVLSGAFIAERCALLGNGNYDLIELARIYGHLTGLESCGASTLEIASSALPAWLRPRSEEASGKDRLSKVGEELRHAANAIADEGFEFERFARSWQLWASDVGNSSLGHGAFDALGLMQQGLAISAVASQSVSVESVARVPALLLLAESASEEDLALAAREVQLVTHENPKVLQAGELLLRAALHLLKRASRPCCSRKSRRKALLSSLHQAAEKAGKQYHAVLDEVQSEVESRDALENAIAGTVHGSSANRLKETLDSLHSDVAVIGRLTASGSEPGREVQAGQVSYLMPAVLWILVAYDSLEEAVLANARLGGESAMRAVFIGTLIAARDAGAAIPQDLADSTLHQLLPALSSGQARADEAPQEDGLKSAGQQLLQLCPMPGLCRGPGLAAARSSSRWGKRRMHSILAEAFIQPFGLTAAGDLKYRIYVRVDATALLPRNLSASEVSFGRETEVQHKGVTCAARYFQFTTKSGRHAPFGVWPAQQLCELSFQKPTFIDSFDILLPDALHYVIGGVVLTSGTTILDVKLPRLAVPSAEQDVKQEVEDGPSWARSSCNHVGVVSFPEGVWLTT